MPSLKKMKYPLKLDIQFFADPPEGGDGKKPDEDDFGDALPSLKDIFKKYPHLRGEHKTRIDEAVSKRFPDYDFDPVEAKKALQEKKDREANGDTTEIVKQQLEATFQNKETKYLERIKGLAVEAYAAKDGLDPKLISRLAAEQVGTLKLDESLRLSADDLDEIIEELRTEFPSAFPVVEANTGDDPEAAGQNPPPVKTKPNPGKQQLNDPPKKGEEAAAEEMKTLFDNLKAKKRI